MSPRLQKYAQVVLPSGPRRRFTYAVPREWELMLRPGHRVRVPFGPRKTHGYVIAVDVPAPDVPRIRKIIAPDPEERLITPEILSLTEWVADYYLAPWGQVLDGAVPANVRKGGSRDRRRKKDAGEAIDLPGAETEDVLQTSGGRGVTLSRDQSAAAVAIRSSLDQGGFTAYLLHGVTGSGKTEVYLDLAERVVEAGGQVLFLVPEIAMGTQILSRVSRRFGPRVGLYHSQAGAAVRRQVWVGAKNGRLPVVVGARSAVFVPMPRLRLVVVDEEHESAYKQEETPRYHGRDVAIYRAREAGATVVLGSATPSLETLHNSVHGKYHRLELPARIDERPHARVTVCDMAEIARADVDPPPGPVSRTGSSAGSGSPARPGSHARPRGSRRAAPPILAPILIQKLQDRLDRGEQTILSLNRRGHSTVVQCGDCGASVRCEHCDVVMTYHRSGELLRCHYCNAVIRGLTECSQCGAGHFFYGGVGTQRVEEAIAESFPSARVTRMDRDTTKQRGTHVRLVDLMETGQVDILLGTQMVAKGFDFPSVTLVGVLQADQEMLMPDFRAAERGFQILTQVSGRAGRGERPGEVVFQTMMPEHYVIASATSGDYVKFAETELEYRQALGYPPFSKMIHLLVDGRDENKVAKRSESLRQHLAGEVERLRVRVTLLGPAPMPISRLKGQFRWHLCLLGKSPKGLHRLAEAALEQKAPAGLSQTRIRVDVDPLQMM